MVITLSAQMFPWALLLISLYIFYIKFHLLNTYFGLILAHTTFALPLTIWIIKGYFDTIPRELEESAYIDGCSRMRALVQVILPLAKPGVTAAGIYIFLFSWNDFLFGITVVPNPKAQPVTVALNNLSGSFSVEWNVVLAGAVIAALPTALIYIFLGRFFVRGLLAGSVKG